MSLLIGTQINVPMPGKGGRVYMLAFQHINIHTKGTGKKIILFKIPDDKEGFLTAKLHDY